MTEGGEGQQSLILVGSAPGGLVGAGPTWWRHLDTKWEEHYVHIYRAREGPGKREGVEKGAVATWKVLYSGDGEEKGTRTMTPNHAHKTQLCSTAEQRVQQEARAPGMTTLGSRRGGPGMPFPGSPSWWLGADIPPLQLQW